jgi:hypothetical protein
MPGAETWRDDSASLVTETGYGDLASFCVSVQGMPFWQSESVQRGRSHWQTRFKSIPAPNLYLTIGSLSGTIQFLTEDRAGTSLTNQAGERHEYPGASNLAASVPGISGHADVGRGVDAVEDCGELWKDELVPGVLIVMPLHQSTKLARTVSLAFGTRTYQQSHSQGSTLDMTLPESHVQTRNSRGRADRSIWTRLGRVPDERQDMPSIAGVFVSGAAGTESAMMSSSAPSIRRRESASHGASIGLPGS